MTAIELLKYQIDGTGGQVSRVVSGLDDSSRDFRLHAGGMSVCEQVTHLGEAYRAVLAASKGDEYEWGSYKPTAETLSDLVGEVMELRKQAVETVLVDDDEKLKRGSDFIVSHDLYHVGQLATLRLNLHPHWNSYEIYGE
jgi:hypothetical protein